MCYKHIIIFITVSAAVNSIKRRAEEILGENLKIQSIESEPPNKTEILQKQLQNERELHQQELKRQAEVFSKILQSEKLKVMSKLGLNNKRYTLCNIIYNGKKNSLRV